MTSTLELVFDLADGWPREELRSRTVEIYVEDLSDIPLPTLGAAVKTLRRTSEFFPTIRAIREAAAEITLDLPSEDEALSQVERRIDLAKRTEDGEGAPSLNVSAPVHVDVRRALDHVGGFYAFRSTSEPSIVRGQFLRIYREIRAGRVRALQVDGFSLQIEAA